MIALHRLTPEGEEFVLNPDLITTVEACPDTIVKLTTGTKLVVAETPDDVVDAVRRWRVQILTDALQRRRV